MDTDADIQLARRLQRDTLYRGRDVEGILDVRLLVYVYLYTYIT